MRALHVAEQLAEDEGIDAEVVDLRSLRPLDMETVAASVAKTNRALCVEEGWPSYGVTAELAARISKACFDDLDAPVERVGMAEVPMPYAKNLEIGRDAERGPDRGGRAQRACVGAPLSGRSRLQQEGDEPPAAVRDVVVVGAAPAGEQHAQRAAEVGLVRAPAADARGRAGADPAARERPGPAAGQAPSRGPDIARERPTV